MEQQPKERFDEWAILELMGHRRLGGRVTEQEIGGANMIRIDVYGADPEAPAITTQFYSAAALYCLTPTTEEIARALGERGRPAPVSRYELEPPRSHYDSAGFDDDDDDDDDDGLPI